jgi:hypothetical protein
MAFSRAVRPILRTLTALALVVSTLSVSPAAATAAPVLRDGASTAHPYTHPLWWPLVTSSSMACYRGNGPDCRNPLYHTVYAMDIGTPNHQAGTPEQPVYAMGAGIVHVGSTGWRCNGTQSRGNWLYIDHGNGIRSEYGHLGSISVRTGDYVTARTKVGTVGQSGYAKCAAKPYVRYLWLAVRHGSSYFHFTSTLACVRGVVTSWPRKLPAYPTDDWNKVPAHTPIPAMGSRSCTTTLPATPIRPTGTRLARAGAGTLRATWTRVSTAAHPTVLNVQLQEYHPSINRWLDYTVRRLTPGYTATSFGGLQKGRQFRVRVSAANSTGWSAPGSWAGGVPG